MLFASATNFHRKSGVAERRDLRFYGPFLEMFFERVDWNRSAVCLSSSRGVFFFPVILALVAHRL